MNVYVETNFVLEIAFAQEQQASCEEILSLCRAERARLVIPAFSIAEAYDTLGRRHLHRKELRAELEGELRQLARSAALSDRLTGLIELAGVLTDSADEEAKRLEETRARLIEAAQVVPLSVEVLIAATGYQLQHDLSPQDSLVYAAVVLHLKETDLPASCFLNRNTRDFDDPDLVAELGTLGCKMLPRFDTGLDFLRSVLAKPAAGTDPDHPA